MLNRYFFSLSSLLVSLTKLKYLVFYQKTGKYTGNNLGYNFIFYGTEHRLNTY